MILDTNALSAMGDGDPNLEQLLQRADQVAIPVIVLGEYQYGIRQSRHRRRYERWLAETIANCRVLRVDEGTASHYAQIRDELKQTGRSIPENELWISALALQHAMPLLSRDAHFDAVSGLKRVVW